MIARVLLERCTHLYMFIGKAINPATKTPICRWTSASRSACWRIWPIPLRAAGKVVKIRYY